MESKLVKSYREYEYRGWLAVQGFQIAYVLGHPVYIGGEHIN